jgi:hypothetical protein
MSKRLTVDQRREIFHALVTTQDVVRDVPKSRQMIQKQFSISETVLRQIEDEGIEREWPPLEEDEPIIQMRHAARA